MAKIRGDPDSWRNVDDASAPGVPGDDRVMNKTRRSHACDPLVALRRSIGLFFSNGMEIVHVAMLSVILPRSAP
jgi:hypothetical protein